MKPLPSNDVRDWNPLPALVGFNVKRLRLSQGLSQTRLSNRLMSNGLLWNTSMISQVENGIQTSVLRLPHLMILAATFEVPLSEFFRNNNRFSNKDLYHLNDAVLITYQTLIKAFAGESLQGEDLIQP